MAHCPNTQETISRYLEGTLTQLEQQDLQEHLATCPDCATAFKQMNLLEEIVKDAVLPPSDITQAAAGVTERLAQQATKPVPAKIAPLFSWRQCLSTAALLAIGIGLGSIWQAPRQSTNQRLSLKAVNLQVAEITGTVMVKHQDAQVWHVLKPDSVIYLGDTFHTTATSDLVLALDATNHIEVNQNSMLTLESYDDQEQQFYLEHGQCTPVLHGPHGPFFIRTPNGRMEALGTEFTVKVTE